MILFLLIQGAVAFIATLSFAVLFNVPRGQYGYSGLTGAVGWMCYELVVELSGSVVGASLAAAILLTVLSRIFAVRRRAPITIFLISGIFPLVPGAGIYYTAYHFIMSDNALAVQKGVETIKIAVAIALGIVLVLSLPYSLIRRVSGKS